MLLSHLIQLMSFCLMANFVASQLKIRDMIEMESKAVSALENYLISTKKNLISLEKLVVDFKKRHNVFENNSVSSENPLDTYIIIKQLTMELNKIENLVLNATTEYEHSMEILREKDEFPQQDTYNKFKNAIIKLQKQYMMSAKDMVLELVSTKNDTNSLSLSAFDCLELAKHAFELYEPEITEEWIIEFDKMCSTEGCNQNVVIEALEYKAYNKYLNGDIKAAHDLTRRILAVDSSHPNAKGNLEFFNNEMNHVPAENRNNTNLKRPDGFLNINELHSFGCRGIIWPDEKITSQLKCRYVHNNSPFLRLAPFKEEELYPDPRIVTYKDVISDDEIEILKNLSYNKFHPSKTVSGKMKIRVSKQAWIDDEEHEVVSRLSRRVADMTTLELETSEAFQVVNYGIGGHYSFHEDYLGGGYLKDDTFESGDRIATVLFYLNNVKSGGGTSFPLLRLMNKGEKGSAILWYNLDESGAEDNRTVHAGCPILEGQKWIANKWILEEGQIFKRRCPSDYKKYDPLPEYKMNPIVFSI